MSSGPACASVSLSNVRGRPFGERTGRREPARLGIFKDVKTVVGGVADASFFNLRSGGVAKNK